MTFFDFLIFISYICIMKNRIVMLFWSPVTSNRANILYIQYIKQSKKNKLNLLKIFYKKYHTQWIVKNKKIIFAVLIMTLTANIKRSEAKATIDTSCIKNSQEIVNVTDSVQKVEITVNNSQNVRDLVYRKTGLVIPKKVPAEHIMLMYNEAIKRDIPISIYFRWIWMESVFNAKAHSKDGATGYTQLMPSTYRHYQKKLKLNASPTNNLIVGGTYLREMFDYWDRNKKRTTREKWELTFASYNGNIGRVITMQAVPKRSARYVRWILKSEYE